MAPFAGILTSVMLAALWLPICGIAADAGPAKQPVGTQEAAGSPSGTGSPSKGETVKKPDQRDVQSRGLFSKKKKKKKPVGGAAGHSSQPQEQTDLPPHDGPGGGSR